MKIKLFIIFLFLYLVTFVVILNFKTPLIGEDIALSIPYNHRNERITVKVPEIANKIYYQMTLWNVRIGEQLAIVFLAFDKSVFNILNTVMFFLFSYYIIVYATGDFPSLKNISTYLWMSLISTVIFLFFPILGEIFFWLDGASNYLWSINLLLLFFLPYRLLISGKNILRNQPLVVIILFYIIGIPAGLSNENTVPTILFFIIGFYVYCRIRKKNLSFRLPTWYLPGVGFLLLGYLILIFAPSTHIRQAYYNQAFNVGHPTISTYLTRAQNIVIQYFHISKGLLLILFILLVIFGLFYWTSKKTIPSSSLYNLAVIGGFTLFSYTSIVILIITPYFEPRSSLLTWFFIMTIIFNIFHLVYNSVARNTITVISIALILVCIYQSHTIFNLYNSFYDEAEFRHYQIVSQLEQGNEIIQVTPFKTLKSRWLNPRDDYLVFTASTHYPSYYGVNEIIFINNKP